MNQNELNLLSSRSSRRAGLMVSFGILVLTGAFAISIWHLFSLDHEIEQKEAKLKSLGSECDALQAQNQRLKQFNKKLDNAIHFQINRNYSTSLDQLNDILQEDPKNEVALYWAAQASYRLTNYQQSVDFALKALDIDSNYFDPYIPLIFSLHKSGKTDDAAKYIKIVINQKIENYSLLYSRTTEFPELWGIKYYRDILVGHQNKLIKMQKILQQLGYYGGPIDALVGSKTEQAINQFFKNQSITNQLDVDGIVAALEAAKK